MSEFTTGTEQSFIGMAGVALYVASVKVKCWPAQCEKGCSFPRCSREVRFFHTKYSAERHIEYLRFCGHHVTITEEFKNAKRNERIGAAAAGRDQVPGREFT